MYAVPLLRLDDAFVQSFACMLPYLCCDRNDAFVCILCTPCAHFRTSFDARMKRYGALIMVLFDALCFKILPRSSTV